MLPLVAILLGVGFVRLMGSRRLPGLDPVRIRWRRASPLIVNWVRRAPATYAYLLILLVTTWVLETSSSTVARQLLLERSTNLHELANDPVRVLIASAFFVTGASAWLAWLGLFSALAAPVDSVQRAAPRLTGPSRSSDVCGVPVSDLAVCPDAVARALANNVAMAPFPDRIPLSALDPPRRRSGSRAGFHVCSVLRATRIVSGREGVG